MTCIIFPFGIAHCFQARVNVAAPSLQWIEKRTAASEFTDKPVLQVLYCNSREYDTIFSKLFACAWNIKNENDMSLRSFCV